mmetsp:Transcript_85555/g.237101  ORF Transcript_85555/g.237101 Transcript_85555/m.237101 type:complete len:281 (+) Transcript_85555:798-1640(+)
MHLGPDRVQDIRQRVHNQGLRRGRGVVALGVDGCEVRQLPQRREGRARRPHVRLLPGAVLGHDDTHQRGLWRHHAAEHPGVPRGNMLHVDCRLCVGLHCRVSGFLVVAARSPQRTVQAVHGRDECAHGPAESAQAAAVQAARVHARVEEPGTASPTAGPAALQHLRRPAARGGPADAGHQDLHDQSVLGGGFGAGRVAGDRQVPRPSVVRQGRDDPDEGKDDLDPRGHRRRGWPDLGAERGFRRERNPAHHRAPRQRRHAADAVLRQHPDPPQALPPQDV